MTLQTRFMRFDKVCLSNLMILEQQSLEMPSCPRRRNVPAHGLEQAWKQRFERGRRKSERHRALRVVRAQEALSNRIVEHAPGASLRQVRDAGCGATLKLAAHKRLGQKTGGFRLEPIVPGHKSLQT